MTSQIDYLVRAIAEEANVRALACVTTDLVNEVCLRHETYPLASAALGRAITAGALMGALLKTRQTVALKFEGSGPLEKIIVEAESNGAVRGYVREPKAALPLKDGKLDVAGGLGRSGLLTVTKDLRMKEPYTGTVQLYTSEIGEDLAYYLMESEQIPSAVGLGVYLEPDGRASAAGGFLIQSLPPSDEAMVDRLAAQIGKLPPVTELFRSGKRPEDLLELIFSGISYRILEKRAIAFRCSCSRERVERALFTLGKRGVEELLEEHGQVEMTCEFCRERYVLTEKDLAWVRGEVQ